MEPPSMDEIVQQKDNGVEEEDDEIDEEDVPGDFFDDFLKEDFMAGLDIVDEDEGDDEKAKKTVTSAQAEDTMKIKRKRSPSRDKRIKLKKCKKKLDEKQEKRVNKKSKDISINVDEFDIRRDPKKTRRDIERDKARCEKDKEKKIITEKLKLVETGLVPPGMEMESDLEEIKKKEKAVRKEGSAHQMTFSVSLSPEKTNRGKNKGSPRQRSVRSPHRRSPVIRRSSPRRSPRRSPPRRSPPRRSPASRRSRSHGRTTLRRSVSPYYRGRRLRHSPGYSRHSPDRDFFSRRRRSRSGSRSPKRRRDEKKSFLQEIAEKLNETRCPVNIMQPLQSLPAEVYQPMPVLRAPAPAPVPPPILPQPYTLSQPRPPAMQQHFDPYDQNFFIGGPQQGHMQHHTEQQPHPVQNIGHQQPHSVQQRLLPSPTQHKPLLPSPTAHKPPLPSPTQHKPTMALQLNSAQQGHQQKKPLGGPFKQIDTKEDISKLFHDKKITLTEFLAITAKPEVYAASPTDIQEKIKVITRCQEAIKILGNSEKKFSGPLVVCKSNNELKPSAEDKYRSPLIRFAQLKVPFTDVPKKDQQQSAFTTYINHLLKSVGLMNEIVVEIEDQEDGNNTKSLQDACPPPAPQISYPRKQKTLETPAHRPAPPSTSSLSKFIQTEAVKCFDCEKRNRLSYKSVGVQCGGEGASFSVSTQVKEDDFYVKIPKNQSLASLTPAQLLAKSAAPKFSRNVDVDDFDLLLPPKNSRLGYGGLPQYSPSAAQSRFEPHPPISNYPHGPSMGGGRERGTSAIMDDRERFGFSNNYY